MEGGSSQRLREAARQGKEVARAAPAYLGRSAGLPRHRVEAVVDLVVHFDKKKASVHARYSTCTAVGMQRVDDARHKITFELHDPLVNASEVMMRAIQALETRVDDSLLQISHQPDPPPKSRCG